MPDPRLIHGGSKTTHKHDASSLKKDKPPFTWGPVDYWCAAAAMTERPARLVHQALRKERFPRLQCWREAAWALQKRAAAGCGLQLKIEDIDCGRKMCSATLNFSPHTTPVVFVSVRAKAREGPSLKGPMYKWMSMDFLFTKEESKKCLSVTM